MSRNYIEITEKKIENIKNNLRVYTVDKLKKELEETKAAYNDTGHDRYFKKMTRLEKELAEIITKYDFIVGSKELKNRLTETLPKGANIVYSPYIESTTTVYAVKKFEISSLFSEPYKPKSEEPKTDTYNKIIAEIEKVNPSLIGPICSIEAHEGAREMQRRILKIVNKCKESED